MLNFFVFVTLGRFPEQAWLASRTRFKGSDPCTLMTCFPRNSEYNARVFLKTKDEKNISTLENVENTTNERNMMIGHVYDSYLPTLTPE